MSAQPIQQRTEAGYLFWVADSGHDRWLAITHGSFGSHEDFIAPLEPLCARYNLLY